MSLSNKPHNMTMPWQLTLCEGMISGVSVVHKFGHNDSVGTSYVPIAVGGAYQMPTSAQALELVSDDANDTAAGLGSRKVIVEGLAGDFTVQTEEVTLNGLTAVALTNNFIRVYRMYVSESGTYANASTGSHAGTLILRGAGAGATWIAIDPTDYAKGQSQTAFYTVPAGKTAYLNNVDITVDSSKIVRVLLMQRLNADTVSAPFSAIRLLKEFHSHNAVEEMRTQIPIGPFAGPCDIGFFGKVSTGTTEIDIHFELILIDD